MPEQPFHKILADFRVEMEACVTDQRFPDLTTFHDLCDELDLLRAKRADEKEVREKLDSMLVVMDYAKKLPTKRQPPSSWDDINQDNWSEKVDEMRKWWRNA